MWQLGLALALLSIGAALLRERCITGAALVLLANWTINSLFCRFSADPYPWGFFLASDYVSGVFVVAGLGMICQRFTFGSVVLALSYAAECVMHAAYGLSDHGAWAQYRYWWAIFWVAVGQMAFVVGWGIYEMARRYARARRSLAPDLAGAAHRGSAATVEP